MWRYTSRYMYIYVGCSLLSAPVTCMHTHDVHSQQFGIAITHSLFIIHNSLMCKLVYCRQDTSSLYLAPAWYWTLLTAAPADMCRVWKFLGAVSNPKADIWPLLNVRSCSESRQRCIESLLMPHTNLSRSMWSRTAPYLQNSARLQSSDRNIDTDSPGYLYLELY